MAGRVAADLTPFFKEHCMKPGYRAPRLAVAIFAVFSMTGAAFAAPCGNDAGGFESWKAHFIQEAAANGVGPRALDTLSRTSYARKTIAADRGQKSFKLTLDSFMQKRGANAIISRGKSMKKRHAALLADI